MEFLVLVALAVLAIPVAWIWVIVSHSKLATRVRLGGFAQQFLEQSELLGHDGLAFRVRVPIRPCCPRPRCVTATSG